jgi:CelD/BcsL family acetyltransferase involved in cellulose biosynthesis
LSASETALPLRIGARTVWTLRRRLVRRRLTLEEALAGEPPRLAPLDHQEDGHLLTALPAALAAAVGRGHPDLTPFVRQSYVRSYARLDIGFDEYFSTFSAKSRSTLKRKVKKLAERSGGALDLRSYRSETEIEVFHGLARAVSARTYQEKRLDAGLPAAPEAIAAMRALARRGLARGWLLFVDGRPVSYLYAPAEGATLIYAFLGYDPDFAAFSPGTVLQLEAMRELMEKGDFRLFDFTEGEGQHKRQFATGGVDCVDLLLVRRTAANLAVGYALNGFDKAVALAKKSATAIGAEAALRRFRR